jgi:4'-phosphopantetheinyl transferase
MNQLWLSDTRCLDPDALQAQLQPMLYAEEVNKFSAIRHANRRLEYLASRALMRMALTQHYHLDLQHWQFSESDNAPPRLLNPAQVPLYISLSHSGTYVFVAISEQAVGIDIERSSQRGDPMSIAKKVFTPEQQKTLSQLPESERTACFYRLWTQKEALVKALHGSTKPFQMISTAAWPTQGVQTSTANFDNYYIALVAAKPRSIFQQYHAQAFGDVERAKIV